MCYSHISIAAPLPADGFKLARNHFYCVLLADFSHSHPDSLLSSSLTAVAAATKPNLARMPSAAHEREASADSRAKAFKNKGKDNEVSGALLPEFAKNQGDENPLFCRNCDGGAMRCRWSCARPRRRTCCRSAATSRWTPTTPTASPPRRCRTSPTGTVITILSNNFRLVDCNRLLVVSHPSFDLIVFTRTGPPHPPSCPWTRSRPASPPTMPTSNSRRCSRPGRSCRGRGTLRSRHSLPPGPSRASWSSSAGQTHLSCSSR